MNCDATAPLAIDDSRPAGWEGKCISFSLTVSFAPGLFFRALQFPFPVGLNVGTADVSLRSRNQLRRKNCGDWLFVPQGEAFDLLVLKPNADSASCMTFHLSGSESAATRTSLSNNCAAEVFVDPSATWNVSLMAERLAIAPTQLRQRLFFEGAALSDIIRKQRCMSALVTLLTTAGSINSIATKAGYTGRYGLETAFRDLLMVDVHLLERPCFDEKRSTRHSIRSELPARIFRIQP